ncbi:MAG TPA: ATP-binding cassette domain-containing protein [Anaerolineae bacterium]|nr:ATP-binding cassette domain-containing protein [Anaerolineae bacterium]
MYITKIEIQGESFPSKRFYPFNIPAIGGTRELRLRSPVVFFVGENGSGKSTLLEAIARRCGIHLWDRPRRNRAYNNPFERRLADYVRVAWANGRAAGSFFRAETFYEMADLLDDVALCDPGRLAYHGGRILHDLSHGEGILSYFQGRLRVRGLYLLDEPEAALSPASQLRFLRLLQELTAPGGSQFLIATHSPLLLACPGAQILSFDESGIKEVSYRETEHYRIYKQFFANSQTSEVSQTSDVSKK